MDLARTAVFFDFDGTVSAADVSVHVLDRLAPEDWRELDRLYDEGHIGSRENLSNLWSLLPADPELLMAVACEIPLDPAFPLLVEMLLEAGSEVAVVSDGLGFYVRERCGDRVAVLTNEMVDGRLAFPNAGTDCPCLGCGTCKRAPIRAAAEAGRHTVFVGDGISDQYAVTEADLVFAKGRLITWCREHGIACTPFAGLGEVAAALSG